MKPLPVIPLTVYTTRADTLFGVTYMVISPEHAYIKKWIDAGLIKNVDAVKVYQDEAARKSDFERTELNKEKTGVKIEGVTAIDPVNGAEVPIFISDYVLATYGTGKVSWPCLPTTAATGVRQEVRPAHYRSRQGQYPGQPG